MPDTAVPLDDLTRQIAQRQSELEALRQQCEARQARLAELARQREALQAQLRQVEADILAVTQGKVSPPAEQTAAPAERAAPAVRGSLTEALVELVREAGRPMTARQLGEELTRRNFRTTSGNLTNLVQNRVSDLVKRGIFRRAKGQPGVILGKPSAPARPAKETARKTAPAEGAASQATPGLRRGQPPLRSVLTQILRKSRAPVSARDLAQQVLAAGYKTKSENFTDVVWTALGQLEGVENIKGQGWRLKRR